ncbi:MAG: IMP dehydrogenase [Candidatus Woesearchaeota archaeon]
MNNWNKIFFKKHRFDALTYDDVTFEPAFSDVLPSQVNLETRLSRNISLKIPLLSSDMDTVTEYLMAIEMAKAGGIGMLWKTTNIEEQEDWVDRVKHAMSAKIEKPITINENQRLEDVLSLLNKYANNFSTLVVVDNNNRVTGLITDDRTQFADSMESKIKDFMLEDPITHVGDLDTNSAYEFMKKRRVPKLLIVNEKKELVSMYTWKDVREIIENINPTYNRDKKGRLRVGANIGVNDIERAERLLLRGCDALLVGTAHGFSDNVISTVKMIKEEFANQYEFDIIAGNVAGYEGAKALCEAGADAIKVGVGPGSICTTRIVAGTGVPQLTALYNSYRAAKEFDIPVIADGGIKYSGHIVKAFIAGAESIMIGSLFAGTDESPGEMITIKGERFIEYRGMGSLGVMDISQGAKERYAQHKNDKSVPEGIEGAVPYTGRVVEQIANLIGGLRSGMGYAGAHSLKELQDKANLFRVSSEGLRESHPHDVIITKEAPNYKR